ncbi:unnamed protein product [Urochloa humidicola]
MGLRHPVTKRRREPRRAWLWPVRRRIRAATALRGSFGRHQRASRRCSESRACQPSSSRRRRPTHRRPGLEVLLAARPSPLARFGATGLWCQVVVPNGGVVSPAVLGSSGRRTWCRRVGPDSATRAMLRRNGGWSEPRLRQPYPGASVAAADPRHRCAGQASTPPLHPPPPLVWSSSMEDGSTRSGRHARCCGFRR